MDAARIACVVCLRGSDVGHVVDGKLYVHRIFWGDFFKSRSPGWVRCGHHRFAASENGSERVAVCVHLVLHSAAALAPAYTARHERKPLASSAGRL